MTLRRRKATPIDLTQAAQQVAVETVARLESLVREVHGPRMASLLRRYPAQLRDQQQLEQLLVFGPWLGVVRYREAAGRRPSRSRIELSADFGPLRARLWVVGDTFPPLMRLELRLDDQPLDRQGSGTTQQLLIDHADALTELLAQLEAEAEEAREQAAQQQAEQALLLEQAQQLERVRERNRAQQLIDEFCGWIARWA